MTAKTNRLTRIARAISARHPEKSKIKIAWICEEMDYAEVDGKQMTIAEYEASRDPNELIVEWPTEEDNRV